MNIKKVTLTALLALPMALFAQETFTLKGKVGNLPNTAKIFMQYEDGEQRIVDSVKINTDGEFKFHGMVQEPTQAYIVLSRDGTPFRELLQPEVNVVYLSQGVIQFEGDNFQDIQASGTALNDEFAKYRQTVGDVSAGMAALNEEYEVASEELRNDPAFIEKLQSKAEAIYAKQNSLNLQFIQDNPKSYITLGLIEELISPSNVKELSSSFEALPAVYRKTFRGQRLQNRLDALLKLAIGNMAPDFTLPDTSGTPIALSSLRGQYVLVDFWASWCGPCRQENPNVVAAYNKFKDKGFTVLGVSLDNPKGKDAWLAAIENDGLEQWPQVSDLKGWKSNAAALYEIRSIPQNYLLDKEGRIVASNLRGAALEEKLAELLH
jgi:peroxiredoxin